MLLRIGQFLFALALLFTATSCILFQGSYTIQGRIIATETGHPMAGIQVTLVKVEGNFSIIPALRPSASTTTDPLGLFMLHVEARRAVYIDVHEPGAAHPSRIQVPPEKIKDGKVRIEIRIKDGHSQIRWNDEDWVPEQYGLRPWKS